MLKKRILAMSIAGLMVATAVPAAFADEEKKDAPAPAAEPAKKEEAAEPAKKEEAAKPDEEQLAEIKARIKKWMKKIGARFKKVLKKYLSEEDLQKLRETWKGIKAKLKELDPDAKRLVRKWGMKFWIKAAKWAKKHKGELGHWIDKLKETFDKKVADLAAEKKK